MWDNCGIMWDSAGDRKSARGRLPFLAHNERAGSKGLLRRLPIWKSTIPLCLHESFAFIASRPLRDATDKLCSGRVRSGSSRRTDTCTCVHVHVSRIRPEPGPEEFLAWPMPGRAWGTQRVYPALGANPFAKLRAGSSGFRGRPRIVANTVAVSITSRR